MFERNASVRGVVCWATIVAIGLVANVAWADEADAGAPTDASAAGSAPDEHAERPPWVVVALGLRAGTWNNDDSGQRPRFGGFGIDVGLWPAGGLRIGLGYSGDFYRRAIWTSLPATASGGVHRASVRERADRFAFSVGYDVLQALEVPFWKGSVVPELQVEQLTLDNGVLPYGALWLGGGLEARWALGGLVSLGAEVGYGAAVVRGSEQAQQELLYDGQLKGRLRLGASASVGLTPFSALQVSYRAERLDHENTSWWQHVATVGVSVALGRR